MHTHVTIGSQLEIKALSNSGSNSILQEYTDFFRLLGIFAHPLCQLMVITVVAVRGSVLHTAVS